MTSIILGIDILHGKAKELSELLTPAVAAVGFELLGCELLGRGATMVLRVYIDSASGVTIADCARVSPQINACLAVEDPSMSNYTLEVSSPGLERPLFTLAQYVPFIGHKIRIKLQLPINERKQFTGTLEKIENNKVYLLEMGNSIEIPYASIQKANLVVDF